MAELAGIGDGSPSVVELPPVTAEDELRLICRRVEQLSSDLELLPPDSPRRPAVADALAALAQERKPRRELPVVGDTSDQSDTTEEVT